MKITVYSGGLLELYQDIFEQYILENSDLSALIIEIKDISILHGVIKQIGERIEKLQKEENQFSTGVFGRGYYGWESVIFGIDNESGDMIMEIYDRYRE